MVFPIMPTTTMSKFLEGVADLFVKVLWGYADNQIVRGKFWAGGKRKLSAFKKTLEKRETTPVHDSSSKSTKAMGGLLVLLSLTTPYAGNGLEGQSHALTNLQPGGPPAFKPLTVLFQLLPSPCQSECHFHKHHQLYLFYSRFHKYVPIEKGSRKFKC